ncbi:YraN family protein [Paenibacillus sp. EC2-1]|uniref:YraN family protein n=1 Tax=Paenibacillus sp. EC2-1 TaxID=3388665 RepID=UPI003BEEB6A6
MSPSPDDKKDTRKLKGALAEAAAATFLMEKGYRIVEQNWRNRTGEIDIIGEYKDMLVFIEVRSRSGNLAFGTPSESVNQRKINQVRSMAEQYLHFKKHYDVPIRFDVVAVILNSDMSVTSIEHIEQAF